MASKKKSSSKKSDKPENAPESMLLVKLLKESVGRVVGAEAAAIVDLLSGKKNVNEFVIAEKLGVTINQTRNILYKLSDEGLVSFVRKKDKKNGGWYTYFWTLETSKSLQSLSRMITMRIEELELQIKLRTSERYYFCPSCTLEFDEEAALLNSFACTECGGVLELRDNSAMIAELTKEAERLRADLGQIQGEAGKVHKKEEDVRMRKVRAEERKKKAERDARRKEKQKLLGKTVKPKKVSSKGKRGKK